MILYDIQCKPKVYEVTATINHASHLCLFSVAIKLFESTGGEELLNWTFKTLLHTGLTLDIITRCKRSFVLSAFYFKEDFFENKCLVIYCFWLQDNKNI